MDNAARLGRRAALLAAALVCAAVSAQSSQDVAEIYRRLVNHEDARAAELIHTHLQHKPDDAVMLYNAACVRCRLGEPEAGASYLIKAIKAGFADFSHLRRDPDLRPIREHPIYRSILAARDAADGFLAQRRLQQWRKTQTDPAYRYEIDEQGRIHYVTSLDEAAHQRMRRMLEKQAAELARTLFEAPPQHYVLIAIPTAQDAERLFDDPHVGGIYTHRKRELITPDTGRSMRHEFVHMFHHSHMDQLGQEHPIWIQEGLASLYEDYRLEPDGSITFEANDRHNITRSLDRTGRLMPWSQVVTLTKRQTKAEAARVYPQLRSIFRFIAAQGRLETWYRSYINRFDEDTTGVAALEDAFGLPLPEIERQWHRWLDQQPLLVTQSEPTGEPRRQQVDPAEVMGGG